MSTGWCVSICVIAAMLAAPAAPRGFQEMPGQEGYKLPSGKSQRDEILKMEHKKSLADVAQILELAGRLQAELQKNDYQVLSLSSLKQVEQIEKLAKQVKKRLKR